MRATTIIMPLVLALTHPIAAHAQSAGDILAAANNAARQSPDASGFTGARVTYAYAPGALYELQTSPNYVSTLLLEPGEAITAIAAGDTSRWSVIEAEAEAAQAPRALILIKPQAANLRTNIVVVTDRRSYVIEARSNAGRAYVAEIAWSYPQTLATALPDTSAMRFDYRVRTMRGRSPPWAPTLVFDDGRRTYLDFAPGVEASDMPPLFIISAEGAELANYRVEGRRYIVDRLFDAAELRIGIRDPIVVRIERGPAPERRAPRRRVRP